MENEKSLKIEKENLLGRLKSKMIERKVNSLIKNEQKLYKYYKSRNLKDRARVTRCLESVICEDSRKITQVQGMEIDSGNGSTRYECNPFNINVLEVARNLDYGIDDSGNGWKQISENIPGYVEYASILGTMLPHGKVPELFGIFLERDAINSATYKKILKGQNGKLLTDENIALLVQNGRTNFEASDLISNPNLLKYNSEIYIDNPQELSKEFIFMHPEILQNTAWKAKNNVLEITLDDISKNKCLLENPIFKQYFSLNSITDVAKVAPELLEDKEISEELMKNYFKEFLTFIDKIPDGNAKLFQEMKNELGKLVRVHSETYAKDVYKFPVKALMPLIYTVEQCKEQYLEEKTIDNDLNGLWWTSITIANRMNKIEEKIDPEFARRIEELYYDPNLILGAHGTEVKDASSFFEKGLKNNDFYTDKVTVRPDITYTVALQNGVTNTNKSELYELLNYTSHATGGDGGNVIYIAIPRNAILPNSNEKIIPIWRKEKGENESYLLPQYIVGALTNVTTSIENNGEFIENPQFNPMYQIEELNQDPNIKYLPDELPLKITKENNER